MKKHFVRLAFLICGASVLWSCTSDRTYVVTPTDSRPTTEQASTQGAVYKQTSDNSRGRFFQQMAPATYKIKLKVQDIRFISSYNPTNRAPNVDHLLPVTPEQIIHRWGENHFVTTGHPDRHLRFVIRDASIVEESIVEGSWSKKTKQRYTGRFEITLQFTDNEGRTLIETTAQAQEQVVVPDETPLSEREKIWFGMVLDLINILIDHIESDLAGPSFNEYISR